MFNNNWVAQQITAIQMAAAAAAAMQQAYPQSAPYLNYNEEIAIESDGDASDDDEEDEQKRTLFIANLDDRITEELLYETFLQAGPIESVRIPKDNTGRQRTFGFVTYLHSCSVPYAMQLLNGLTLFRKPLTIKYQNSTSLQPIPRRSLPLPGQNENQHSTRRSDGHYDNSSLRASNYPAVYDTNNKNDSSSLRNPFQNASAADWVRGSGGHQRDRISKHSSTQSRSHSNTPYQRPDTSASSRRNGGNDRRSGEHQRRQHHNEGSNRRSEQRSSNQRR